MYCYLEEDLMKLTIIALCDDDLFLLSPYLISFFYICCILVRSLTRAFLYYVYAYIRMPPRDAHRLVACIAGSLIDKKYFSVAFEYKRRSINLTSGSDNTRHSDSRGTERILLRTKKLLQKVFRGFDTSND